MSDYQCSPPPCPCTPDCEHDQAPPEGEATQLPPSLLGVPDTGEGHGVQLPED